MKQLVYTLDIDNRPLMPTSRCGHVRKLLNSGLAVVTNMCPFTIKLTYKTTTYKQPITLGVDTGFAHIGLSASTEKQEVFSAEVDLRTDVSKLIQDRAMMRRSRRSRKTRCRQPRFANRRSKYQAGWLAPSTLHREQSHVQAIRNIANILPVSKIIVETTSFDIQKINNPDIQGVDYQHGQLFGFENLKQYVKVRDNFTCQHCKGKSGDNRLEVHHLIPRSEDGKDKPDNLITLCSKCHHDAHSSSNILTDLKTKFYKKQRSFKEAAGVSSMKTNLIKDLKIEFGNVETTFGYITKSNRILHNIEKTHHLDAFCVARNFNAAQLNYFYKFR